ncbi:hypothetical protein CXB51_025224 [Gossypium anomalum]|uniref:O-methyltransferase C-terminal domain-containing protein n=1 Tax=Gossypium anomalum TaxID=47600 RepID=A0A8J5YJS4_9ROSI|nr:hypothetical protein CXB51_025224 [Gossypium anomalum]
MPTYQYKGLNPENAKRFDTAMKNLSKIIVKKIHETYNGFQGVTTLVDVGGGYGVTLNMIISKYPSIKGVNFDLPHVVQQAPSFPGGDMFSTVPRADTIMMKEVLHNCDDEHCLKLLKNCYEAMEEKGKVIVKSYMMFEEAEASNAAKFIKFDYNKISYHFSKKFCYFIGFRFSFSQFDVVEAPSPAADSCNGIFLSYAYSSGTKLKPTDPTHQPYRFESVLMVLNNGDEELKSWKYMKLKPSAKVSQLMQSLSPLNSQNETHGDALSGSSSMDSNGAAWTS